jgi:hypothetical protein
MTRFFAAVMLLAVAAGSAAAGTPIASPYFNPYTGRMGPNPAKNWLTGECVPPPQFSPVVGSVQRVSHLSHPITGLAKYKGSALDPKTGRVYQYKFRQ